MKQLSTFLLSIIFMTGCATWIRANSECANPAWKFSDTVACINKTTDGSRNQYDVSYRLTANQLLEQMNAGKISEATAKMQLQDKFMLLKRDLNTDDSMYCIATGKSSAMCY